MNRIINHYNTTNEEKRFTSKSHLPEYLITMNYIKKYLTPNARILEIGAGTGRYAIALADKGYEIDAVELVPSNIKVMKKKVHSGHKINIYEGNACNLSFLKDNTYDIVLLLGPMYHLFTDEDKHKALSEAIRLAKKNAIIYTAYINNDTCIYKFFANKKIIKNMKKGFITKEFRIRPKMVFETYRKTDIDKLIKLYDVTRLHFVGTDMLSCIFDNRFDKLSDEEFTLYMKYLESICEREDMVGLSCHMLDIFRKN